MADLCGTKKFMAAQIEQAPVPSPETDTDMNDEEKDEELSEDGFNDIEVLTAKSDDSHDCDNSDDSDDSPDSDDSSGPEEEKEEETELRAQRNKTLISRVQYEKSKGDIIKQYKKAKKDMLDRQRIIDRGLF